MSAPQQHDPYAPKPYDGYGPSGETHDPYRQQRSGCGALWWLWAILGGGGLFALLCCGACCGIGSWALGEIDQQIQAQLQEVEVIREHIGDITKFERDWGRSIRDGEENVWHYRIEGDKGSGYVVLYQPHGDELVDWARLELDTGEEFEVLP